MTLSPLLAAPSALPSPPCPTDPFSNAPTVRGHTFSCVILQHRVHPGGGSGAAARAWHVEGVALGRGRVLRRRVLPRARRGAPGVMARRVPEVSIGLGPEGELDWGRGVQARVCAVVPTRMGTSTTDPTTAESALLFIGLISTACSLCTRAGEGAPTRSAAPGASAGPHSPRDAAGAGSAAAHVSFTEFGCAVGTLWKCCPRVAVSLT